MNPKEEHEYQKLLDRSNARRFIIEHPGKTAEQLSSVGIDPDIIDWLLMKEYIQFDGNLGLEAKPI